MSNNIPTRFSRSALVEGYNQGKFSNLRVAVIGSGATGNYVALGIVGFGVKEIVLVDFDTVDESNLNRQLVFTNSDIGKVKSTALKERLDERILVDHTIVTDQPVQITPDNINFILEDANGKPVDVVFLCVDNVQTRLEINDYCVPRKIPMINGGTSKGIYGEVYTIIPGVTPCLRCWMKPATDRVNCSAEKDPSIVGTSMLISSMMILEFQNLFTGKKTIPPILKLSSSRRAYKDVMIEETKKSMNDDDGTPEPFYHVKISPLKTCNCQKK